MSFSRSNSPKREWAILLNAGYLWLPNTEPEDVVSFVCCSLLGHGEYGLSNQPLCIFDLAPADSSVFMQAGQGTLVSGCV